MNDNISHLDLDEIKNFIIFDIENKVKLKLTKEQLKLKLNFNNRKLKGTVYLFDEYYQSFHIDMPKEKLFETICKYTLLVLSEFGDLEGVITSGRKKTLESELEETTAEILNLIKEKKRASNQIGEVTIMIDEHYPYNEIYENNFPVLQFEVKDSNGRLNIVQKLEADLTNFDHKYMIKRVDRALNEIIG